MSTCCAGSYANEHPKWSLSVSPWWLNIIHEQIFSIYLVPFVFCPKSWQLWKNVVWEPDLAALRRGSIYSLVLAQPPTGGINRVPRCFQGNYVKQAFQPWTSQRKRSFSDEAAGSNRKNSQWKLTPFVVNLQENICSWFALARSSESPSTRTRNGKDAVSARTSTGSCSLTKYVDVAGLPLELLLTVQLRSGVCPGLGFWFLLSRVDLKPPCFAKWCILQYFLVWIRAYPCVIQLNWNQLSVMSQRGVKLSRFITGLSRQVPWFVATIGKASFLAITHILADFSLLVFTFRCLLAAPQEPEPMNNYMMMSKYLS